MNVKNNHTNNEEFYFVESEAREYNTAGWSIEHAQSKTHLFLNSRFDGGFCGRYGVTTAHGLRSGSFKWIGGGGGNNLSAAFLLGGSDDFILIRDAELAGSS